MFDRNSTVQLFVSLDSEEVADDNVPLEKHHANGAVVDFSHEAANEI